MALEIGLTDTQREEAAGALRALLADTYALYLKTHGYHWNVTGPRFSELHGLFMEQYTELWQALDKIAERIRALGHFAPGSSEDMHASATITADNGVPDAETMIRNLVGGHETLARIAKRGIKSAEALGDDVSSDLFVQRAAIAEKTAWMLRSSL
ncbi:MAG: DNA starvation/stationary phase protection protein [Pseudomonadota bacterium]